MPAPVGTYDLNACTLMIGTFQVSGFGEGDGITIEPVEDAQVPTFGIGGAVAVSRSGVTAHNVTINVLTTSKSYKHLSDLLEAQFAETPIQALAFRLMDPGNGDSVSDSHFVFTARPAMSKGKTVASVDFKGVLPSPTIRRGADL